MESNPKATMLIDEPMLDFHLDYKRLCKASYLQYDITPLNDSVYGGTIQKLIHNIVDTTLSTMPNS